MPLTTSAYLRNDLGGRDDIAAALERVVDERWDLPVTLAVRLVSVVNDTTQHAGQAAFVRGIRAAGVARRRTGDPA